MAAELQIFKTPLFDSNDLKVSSHNGRLIFRINGRWSMLNPDDVVVLSNKLHEWLGAIPQDVDLADVLSRPPFVEVADEQSQLSSVYDSADWAAYVKELEADPSLAYRVDCAADAAGRQRFSDDCQAKYRDINYSK